MANQLQNRTARFARDIFCAWRPRLRSLETKFVAAQVIRSSASTAANYRAACLGRSRAEFVAKLGVVREEADETVFWLEYADGIGGLQNPPLEGLLTEARELSAIFSAAYRTARKRGK